MLEKIIKTVSPAWAVSREKDRLNLDSLKNAGNIQASYKGAIAGRLSTSWVNSSYQGSETQGKLESTDLAKMRSRSRNLCDNNPIARAIIDRIVLNVIKHGFNFQARTGDPAFNDTAENLFWNWTRTADLSGESWVEHQSKIVRWLLTDGDVLILLKNDGVLVIGGNRIATPYGQSAVGNIVDGIEIDSNGKPVAFWIDNGFNASPKFSRVIARDAILISRKVKEGSVRGEPVFSQSFPLFDQLENYVESTVVAANINACLAAVVQRTNSNSYFNNLQTQAGPNNTTQRLTNIEPGMVGYLNAGEEIKTISASQPIPAFDAFVTSMLKLICMPMGVSIDVFGMGDASFSGARVNIESSRDYFKSLQTKLIDSYLTRLYQWRISKFIKDGDLKDRKDAWLHDWVAPAFDYINPKDDIMADALAIETGIETYTDVLARRNIYLEEHLEILEKEQKMLKDRGIILRASQQTTAKPEDIANANNQNK